MMAMPAMDNHEPKVDPEIVWVTQTTLVTSKRKKRPAAAGRPAEENADMKPICLIR
jgi:hypothetical protein